MIVSLYTSRVILNVLGVDDFGLYQTVGGVVSLLAFVNGALSVGTSRFLTFELGKNDNEKLKRTFSTVLLSHVFLSVIVVIVAETAGLWVVEHKLVIHPERLNSAIWVYQLSILTSIITITQVPYNASIISHEKMGVYAYASIIEVLLKLLAVYLIALSEWDKLVYYAVLICIIHMGIALYYRFYCIRNFKETRFSYCFDKKIFRAITGYSGWNLLANTSLALTNQGATILINVFFNPSIVASRVIANQVNMAANQFINNFRTAANPQIVKRYAIQDYEGSKSLLLLSTKFSYYLMLMLALPIFVVAEPLLKLWLGQVPTFSVLFLKYAVITSLFQVFDTSLYTALYAKGQIKENALLSPTIEIVAFLFTWLAYYLGYSPIAYSVLLLVAYAIQGIIIKPILLIKIVNYTYKDMMSIFLPCVKVTIAAVILPLTCNAYFGDIINNSLLVALFSVCTSVILVVFSSWYLGMDKANKDQLIEIVRAKLQNKIGTI